MSLKPWRTLAIPHEDVRKGDFQQAEFAADISRVNDGNATPEYQDPEMFFKRTFITEGMGLLLNSVLKRLSGKGGDPVIQLQTAFGGGKTHTMLAVYHIAKHSAKANSLPGLSDIFEKAKIKELPQVNIAVLDGIKMSPSQPKKYGKISTRTLWGELAMQLGKEAGYELVKDADISGTSPGKETLATLIKQFSPCVILIDELVAYIRQFEDGKSYTGGTFDSNITFIQALTEAMKAAPSAVLLASLPESAKEAGSQRGQQALDTLSHYFGRVQALWKPVATEEAFEIVRRRLFENIADKKAVEGVCRAYADFYIKNATEFPQNTQESHYYERLVNAYPIHPEVFDRLYEDWSTLDNFQRTRGVLKLMAKVIHRLWADNNQNLLIQPADMPLYDADVRNEAIYYLPQGWDPVLETDIDGNRAETAEIEKQDPRFGADQACRRTARTIFLGSAPSNSGQRARGIQENRIVLGCAQPEQLPQLYKDAIRRLADKLHYLNSDNTNKYWFDTRPNLRREMEERKRRFAGKEKEKVSPIIKASLQSLLSGDVFDGVHVFTPAGDVPDDVALRLVALPPDAEFSTTFPKHATEKALEILKSRGEQPRQRQNRLIFIAPDKQVVGRLIDQVKTMLAWQSIVEDVKNMRLNLDQIQARQAGQALKQASDVIDRTVKETYKWLLVPVQDVTSEKDISEIKWEHKAINTSGANTSIEIRRVLKDEELVIFEWAPLHLSNLLKKWFWKQDAKDVGAMDVWEKTCCYLYLPRLQNEATYKNAMLLGSSSKDFFAFAYSKADGRYTGFSFGSYTDMALDSSLLLIEPKHAAEIEAQYRVQVPAAGGGESKDPGTKPATGGHTPVPQPPTTKGHNKKRFYGNVELDPVRAKYDFGQIADEVLQHFVSKPDTKVRISIEIHAESVSGFNDGAQRTIRENSKSLKFKNAEFEDQ